MKTAEFNRLVEHTVHQFLPRLPEKYRGGFTGIFSGGEHWMAVEDLIYALADDHIPVTPDERDTLRRLALEARGDADLLNTLDGLTVSTGPAER